MVDEEYEVVTYQRSQAVIFDKFENAERYLESIEEMDTDSIHFIERDGVAIR